MTVEYHILNNKKGISACVLFVANNEGSNTITIAGNNSVSDIAIDDEILTGAFIKQTWFGSSSGDGAVWSVQRGANTVGIFDSTAWMDRDWETTFV